MLAWLERQYAQLDEGYQRTATEMREVKDALARERTVNARARATVDGWTHSVRTELVRRQG